MATILVVDDEPSVRFALREVLEDHDVLEAADVATALPQVERADLVITDLAMPGRDGLSLLDELRREWPTLPVIMLTAHGNERTAVAAMKRGAYDYLIKPFDIDEVLSAVERALETRRLRQSANLQRTEHALGAPIVGESPAIRRVLEQALRVAPRDVPVLVTGETGTGKELIATALHAHSRRHDKPLVRFNCAAIAAELAEAELFGHTRGAFTGASASSEGYFGAAAGGTLVLDEVGELPLTIQPKLLRALQDGEIQPVGQSTPKRVDVRIVACTHRDLAAEAEAERFRRDLYYRLAVVELRVPPLSERREDIPGLVEALRRRHAKRLMLDDLPADASLLAALQARPWPGNVRELENWIVRQLALSERGELRAETNDLELAPSHPGDSPNVDPRPLAERMAAHERELLRQALDQAEGNRSHAARTLGITRTTLLDKMKRLGLSSYRAGTGP